MCQKPLNQVTTATFSRPKKQCPCLQQYKIVFGILLPSSTYLCGFFETWEPNSPEDRSSRCLAIDFKDHEIFTELIMSFQNFPMKPVKSNHIIFPCKKSKLTKICEAKPDRTVPTGQILSSTVRNSPRMPQDFGDRSHLMGLPMEAQHVHTAYSHIHNYKNPYICMYIYMCVCD